MKVALLSLIRNTPSTSSRFWPGLSSRRAPASARGCGGPNWKRGFGGRGSCTALPFSSKTSSRTVSDWIGTDNACLRVAVVISAVHVKPGRTSGIWPSMVTTTLKFVAVRVVPAPRRLDRAVADLGDLAGEFLVGNRVDRDLRALAQSARTGCRFRRLRPRLRSPTCRRPSAAPCRRCSWCRP